jgi:hypothetical protein
MLMVPSSKRYQSIIRGVIGFEKFMIAGHPVGRAVTEGFNKMLSPDTQTLRANDGVSIEHVAQVNYSVWLILNYDRCYPFQDTATER